MPIRLIVFIAACGGTLWLAGQAIFAQEPAPPPPALPPPPVLVRTAPDAPVYSQNLLHVMEEIERDYVRPVARADMLVAALSGLYEVTGESMPPTLRKDAEKAIEAKQELRFVLETRKRLAMARRLNDEEALLASCRAMVRILDPYCDILTGDEARRASGRMDNFGVGIDLEESGSNDSVRIKEVLPGSPAQTAGLLPGDRITAIDGKKLRDANPVLATLALNGRQSPTPDLDIQLVVDGSPVPDNVQLTIERGPSTKQREMRLQRRKFHVETVFGIQRRDDNSWEYWIDREQKIAHVRLGPVREDTAGELREVISKLREEGMRGLLLDLRWCPGGLLHESSEAAGLFLGKGNIYKTNIRTKREPSAFRQRGTRPLPGHADPRTGQQ